VSTHTGRCPDCVLWPWELTSKAAHVCTVGARCVIQWQWHNKNLWRHDVVGAWLEHSPVCVNQVRSYCVIQKEMSQSKSLATRHGRRTFGGQSDVCVCVN
jgi:hypothetical protein